MFKANSVSRSQTLVVSSAKWLDDTLGQKLVVFVIEDPENHKTRSQIDQVGGLYLFLMLNVQPLSRISLKT